MALQETLHRGGVERQAPGGQRIAQLPGGNRRLRLQNAEKGLCLMASRWKYDRPMSRATFEARFPDEASCARPLAASRWPDGFVCPACGHDRGRELKRRRASRECAACGKETPVTAGTIMHRSPLPLKIRFMAVHIVTSHSNGISALQLQARLGLGSYKSARLLLHKLRRAMVDPDRSLLECRESESLES